MTEQLLASWALLSAGWITRGMAIAYRTRRRLGAPVREAVTGRKPDVKLPKVTESA